jgi:hypothetical protein
MKYHYTIGHKVALILADKLIRPTELHLERGERGVVWFTTRSTFEPTAVKGVGAADNGMVCTVPTLKELAELGGGLYRFGVPDNHPQLYPWLKICRLAHTPKIIRVRLEEIARQKGANPHVLGQLVADFDS